MPEIEAAAQADGIRPEVLLGQAIYHRVVRAEKRLATSAALSETGGDAEAFLRVIKKYNIEFTRGGAQPGLPSGCTTEGISPLENEIYAVGGLVEMLSQRLAEYQQDCSSQNTKHAATGTLELAERTMTGLWGAFHNAWEYYRTNGQPGAGAVAPETAKAAAGVAGKSL